MHPYDLLVLGWGQEDLEPYVELFRLRFRNKWAAAHWWKRHGREAASGGPVNMGFEELTGAPATVLPGYKPKWPGFPEGKFE